MKKSKKLCETSIRVLETLKLLTQKNMSVNDIIRHFEKTEPNNRSYTNEVILKYINTLKVFGFRIIKDRDKYVLLNTPNKIELNEKDLGAVCLLEKFAKILPEESLKKEVGSFLHELEKHFSDNTRLIAHTVRKPDEINFQINYEKYKKQVKEYEKYCLDGQRLKISYRNSAKSNCSAIAEPNEIKYVGRELFFKVYNPASAQIQEINFNDIVKIEQLPSKSNPKNMLSSVSFKLKNRLAKTYKLHDGERLLASEENGDIIILNQGEDRHLLIRRILRYGENCEIISPNDLREEIKTVIKSALGHY